MKYRGWDFTVEIFKLFRMPGMEDQDHIHVTLLHGIELIKNKIFVNIQCAMFVVK